MIISFIFASQITQTIQDQYVKISNYLIKAPSKFIDASSCHNAKELRLYVIFLNLLIIGIIRLFIGLIGQIGAGIVFKINSFIKEKLNLKYVGQSNILILINLLSKPFEQMCLFGLFGVLPLSYSIRGKNDLNAPIKLPLHKDFSDGFLLLLFLNGRTIQDIKGLSNIPLMSTIMDGYESLKLDRQDAKSRKRAALEAYYHTQDYFKQKGAVKPLFVFAEGAMSNDQQMKLFQPGIFNCLGGVQQVNFGFEKDIFTNIGPSNARSQGLFILCNLSKVQSVQDFHYQDTFQQESEDKIDIKIDTSKPIDDLLNFVEANKEILKKQSELFSIQVHKKIFDKFNFKLRDDYRLFDGFDAINYRLQMIKNFSIYKEQEKKILESRKNLPQKDRRLKPEDQLKINKELFFEWIILHRDQTLNKIRDQSQAQRTNEELKKSIN